MVINSASFQPDFSPLKMQNFSQASNRGMPFKSLSMCIEQTIDESKNSPKTTSKDLTADGSFTPSHANSNPFKQAG
jgi:hypothetical protein